jgi:acyl-CoA reductase-like NAD-dependent aldehyde dehydrogenase
MNDYLVKAIHKLKPTAQFSFSNDDYSTIKWDVLEGDAPTQAEIDAAIKAVKAEEKAEIKARATQRQAILDRLGLTADEAQLLLG